MFAAFQATFAGITCCLILGAFAERIKFSRRARVHGAVVHLQLYLPVAHMVWFWAGPDAYTECEDRRRSQTKLAGLIWQWGALDFAGGTVVHINAAVAGLVGAYMVGKRVGYGKEAMPPHNLPMTMIGAALLWVGWFGFNAGSATWKPTVLPALAFINTFVATACRGAGLVRWARQCCARARPSMLGAASGAVAGLVAITPAAGNVGMSAGALRHRPDRRRLHLPVGREWPEEACSRRGRLAGRVRRAWHRRHRRRAAHRRVQQPGLGRPGFVADWVTASMVKPEDYSIAAQFITQAKAVGLTVLWSAVVSVVAYKLVDLTIGLRVTEEEEREGLDIASHGETAYSK